MKTINNYVQRLTVCNRNIDKMLRKEKDLRKRKLLVEIMWCNTQIIIRN